MEQSGGVDRFAEGETTGGENDDCPEEIVEVFFGKNAGAEEQDERNDCNDSHVAKKPLQLMTDAPENDCAKGDERDEPLYASEFILDRSNGYDCGSSTWLEGQE